jgi:hypothetical protein
MKTNARDVAAAMAAFGGDATEIATAIGVLVYDYDSIAIGAFETALANDQAVAYGHPHASDETVARAVVAAACLKWSVTTDEAETTSLLLRRLASRRRATHEKSERV